MVGEPYLGNEIDPITGMEINSGIPLPVGVQPLTPQPVTAGAGATPAAKDYVLVDGQPTWAYHVPSGQFVARSNIPDYLIDFSRPVNSRGEFSGAGATVPTSAPPTGAAPGAAQPVTAKH